MKRIALMLLLALPSVGAAQSESFIVRLGPDTIAMETFVRSANRLEGELSGVALRGRTRYVVDFSNGMPARMMVEAFAMTADTPHIKAAITFTADSAIADMTRGGAAVPQQRLPMKAGAVPFINLSFALTELVTTRGARAVGDSATVWFFVIGDGASVNGKLNRITADSATLNLGGVELRMHLDARGRILHINVPAQNLTVERVAGTLNRAPESQPDYSAPANAIYTAEDVTVRTSAGHTLAGTLTLPKQRKGKIPAVITISGSGSQDRDEALPGLRGYRPFRELAEALAGRGVAVLRYDDRGFGASTGVYADATSADFADDTRAVLAYLRSRPEIDASKIFLVGHSEGGMIAPLVAAEDPKLRGIVLLAGPGWPGRQILEYQTRHGVDLQTGKTQAERDSLYRAGLTSLDTLAAKQPWMRYFMDYDPLPVVRKVSSPVLIVHGATDRQVTAEQAGVLANTLRAAGNRDVAVHVLPDVNHLFLSDPVGNAPGYSSLATRTVVPQLLQLVGDWIVNKSK